MADDVTVGHRHAPRGPIKAKHPKDGQDHTDVPQCTATAKGTRQRCKRRPIPGGTVCVKHGGGAPQVKAAAAKRLDELRPKAIQRLDWLLDQEAFPTVILGAVKDILDRNDGKPHESVSVDMHVTAIGAKLDAARQAARERNASKAQ